MALSGTMTLRLPRERNRGNVMRNASKVNGLKLGHTEEAILPVRGLSAPKQAMELPVAACVPTGFRAPAPFSVLLEVASVQNP